MQVYVSVYCNAPPNSALHHHNSDPHEQSSTPLSRRKNTGNVLVSPNKDMEAPRCEDLIALGRVAAIKNEPNSSNISHNNRSRSQNATSSGQIGQVMQLPLNGFLPKSSMNPTLARLNIYFFMFLFEKKNFFLDQFESNKIRT